MVISYHPSFRDDDIKWGRIEVRWWGTNPSQAMKYIEAARRRKMATGAYDKLQREQNKDKDKVKSYNPFSQKVTTLFKTK